MRNQNLPAKLNRLGNLLDLDEVLKLNAESTDNVASYYKTNKLAYKLFHSKTDFVHMGISDSEAYSEKDLFKQAEIIESYFNKKTMKVLEIGCGKGKNLEFLASKNPEIEFYGLDLKDGQTDIAKKRAENLSNMHVEFGDFHKIYQFGEKKFDLIFVVEALCHSNDKAGVAREVAKVLHPNGLFIVFDGYLASKDKSLTNDLIRACELVEKGMMVDAFEEYDGVKDKVTKQGFKLEEETDYSVNILPTLYKFERLANLAFRFGRFSKIIFKLLPSNFKNNAISGYLMPDLVQSGAAKYYFSVFRKL